MLMSVVLFSSVAYTYWRRGHVSMDIVTGKLSELNKNRLGAITTVWSLAVVFFCITCMGKYAMTTTDTTSVWNMSYKPFIWFAVFGCVLLFLAMLSHLLDQLAAIIRGGGMGSAFLMLGIGLLGVALSVWVAVERLPGISAPAQGVIGMVYMFTMFFLGMPVAFALMGTSLVFIASLRGLTAALNLFGTAWFSTCSSYTWAPLMFFLQPVRRRPVPHGPQLVRSFPRRPRHSQRVCLYRPRRGGGRRLGRLYRHDDHRPARNAAARL